METVKADTTTPTDDQLSAEILPLEDIDVEATPPCECVFAWIWQFRLTARLKRGEMAGRRACGKPSVARMRVNCGACGARYSLFLCRQHAWFFRQGKAVHCRTCLQRGTCKARDI